MFFIFPELEQNIHGQKFTHDRSADDSQASVNSKEKRMSKHQVNAPVAAEGGVMCSITAVDVQFTLNFSLLLY